MMGAQLGTAHVKGFGMVRVFEDLNFRDQFYIIGIRHDRRGHKHRRMIQWRKRN